MWSLLSSISTQSMLSYYGWVCCCCRPSVNTICGRIMVGFVDVVIQKTQYVVVLWLGLSLLSSVCKHKMWSYYDSVCCCCRSSVNTVCGGIMVGIVVRQ